MQDNVVAKRAHFVRMFTVLEQHFHLAETRYPLFQCVEKRRFYHQLIFFFDMLLDTA